MKRRDFDAVASEKPADRRIRDWKRAAIGWATVTIILVAAILYFSSSNRPPSNTPNKVGRNNASLILFTRSRGAKAAGRSSTAQCEPSQLTTDFWTTIPEGPGLVYSGFTVVNSGTASCTLPEELTDLSITSSDNSAAKFAGFVATSPIPTYSANQIPDSPSITSSPEFANLSLSTANGEATINFGASDNPVQIEPIALAPSGSAVVVFESLFDINSDQSSCLSVPASDGLNVGIPSGNIFIKIPTMPAPGGANENPNSSAFYECATSGVTPFVTWSQAVQMVGGPGLVIGPQGQPVPGADNSILSLAP